MDALYVACLCAQWCSVCNAWRPVFETLGRQLPPDTAPVRWAWIDVEDQADVLGDYEPPNFPVLVVQRGGDLLYCAALPQQPGLWLRVVSELARQDSGSVAADADLPDLRPLFGGGA